ncbi:TetR/AcrR family transcriptional regulator [Iamia sp. SCSIO 61187]|uniref:TetR/AcrR family transcriptional regulator n=1 Tax=Iamia sp. SCSIO 61187 TaxID=2722752 RepID=UPI001C62B946|nr:TetR/AcrR family transcriptional regulator [Iamia sp. SCSIO 61187]QYG91731.1 TetR/AcrR family transcriptional regulator [Iamia sp. SCSIO 61187]
MGRPAKFTSTDILDAAADLVAQGGPTMATVAAISDRLQAPSGSVYHRFATRDLLVAQLWVQLVREAQAGFIEALALDDVDEAAKQACLHVPRWSRANLPKAQVLLLYRRSDLVEHWPDEMGEDLATLNDGLARALRSYTRRRFSTSSARARRTVTFALIDVPFAGVRSYLQAGQAPPKHVDELVLRTCRCILAGP